MRVMEGRGVDGHVGDDFLCCFNVYLLPCWFEMVLTQCDDTRAVL